MSTQLRSIAIHRLRIVPIPQVSANEAPLLDPKHKLVILAELAKIGVRVRRAELLDTASAAFACEYTQAIEALTALRGGAVDYVPLFLDFPSAVPDDDAYFAKRIIGYLGNFFDVFDRDGAADQGRVLENGMVVPEWLFDLEKFGADPISQFQTPTLWQRAKERLRGRKEDTRVEWLEVELVPRHELEERLRDWLRACLYARSSIKQTWLGDLAVLLDHCGPEVLDFEQITQKENRARVLQLLWSNDRLDAVAELVRTATDLLRLFAALTGTDTSLATRVTLPKMNRRQRRAVLAMLERAPALAEDLKRYRGLWLEAGRYLHPGEYAKRYPKTFAAFDALRNGTIRTFDGRTELLLAEGDLTGTLRHLGRRPGVLARRLHELLRRFPGNAASVLDAFESVTPSMAAKNLLVLRCYFASINDSEHRTVINKKGKIKVLPNNSVGALSSETLERIDTLLHTALVTALGERESWDGKEVWIDPRLSTYTVPLAQRAASDGLLTFGRGTRIPLHMDEVLRLFVYWKQTRARTDLDLSVIQFGQDFGYAGHVSYTQLKSAGIVHSGDLQSAPMGAAEFIDITLAELSPKVRYLATQVYRYSGEAFADMQCHAGWMIRSEVDSDYASFDIRTVANKFDLHGRAGYAVPLVVDLEAEEIILTDLYMGNKAFHNRVEGAFGNVSLVAREIARFTTTRPTLQMLAELHREARRGSVGENRESEITFGIENCSYNAGDTADLLSELL